MRTPGISTGNASSLSGQFEEAMNQIGFSTMDDESAARLLAFLYLMGGGNEEVVYNKRLLSDIHIAQQKFNLYGGEVPNGKLLPLFNSTVRELEKAEQESRGKSGKDFLASMFSTCKWLKSLYDKYGLNK
jgi:hypothetical protein